MSKTQELANEFLTTSVRLVDKAERKDTDAFDAALIQYSFAMGRLTGMVAENEQLKAEIAELKEALERK